MKIYCLSLGCAKNKVDSECLAGELERAGHVLVDDIESADVGIVNTCGFIQPATEESIAAILDLEQLKKEGRLKKIGVVGCLVNRYSDDLIKEMPSVDFWARSEDWSSVIRSMGGFPENKRRRGRLPSSSKITRYLKISEGCDNKCTYCAIPGIRGGLRSLSIDTIVSEADQLVKEGASELCVVGQDLTVYGIDIYGRGSLTSSSMNWKELSQNIWIRLLYLHPSRVTTGLLERVASGIQILPYLDIPIQHADPEILSAMNRKITPEELTSIFNTARSINDDFALRTTCMVGFRAKRRHFDNLLAFVSATRFDRMGAFAFHPEEGLKQKRWRAGIRSGQAETAQKLMALQERYPRNARKNSWAESWMSLSRGSTGRLLLLREGVSARPQK